MARREDLWTSLTDRQLLAYLARTVHNLTISKLRKTGRELLAENLDETVAGDDALERLLDRLTREEQRRQCAAALQALSPRDRTILIQKYLFQYSDERIAEGLGIRRASCRWRSAGPGTGCGGPGRIGEGRAAPCLI